MRKLSRARVIFVALACVSFLGLLLLGPRLKDRNWSSASALLVFAFFLTCAACGGGSGGGGGGGPAIGILTGYDATPGYDRATGLGSLNATNLVNNW